MSKLLIAYANDSNHVTTTQEYLLSFKEYSRFTPQFLHVTKNALPCVNLNLFDAILVNYCIRLCFPGHVSEEFLEALSEYQGVKALIVQDEYNQTNNLIQIIKKVDFDIILTCVPQQKIDYVFQKANFPNTEFKTVLTGYVSERLINLNHYALPLKERKIAVGYRGRSLGMVYGKLGTMKFEIGQKMQKICQDRAIPHDIAMDENSRIYGEDWYKFIGSCRTVLGTESGSNVFDFDGSIENEIRQAGLENRSVSNDFINLIERREKEINMGQISPKMFEAAVLKTPMILYSGHYSGILKPEEHYIDLYPDFSNIDNVILKLSNLDFLETIADNTYSHLVKSGCFHYSQFVDTVDELLKKHMDLKKFNNVNHAQLFVYEPCGELLEETPTDEPREPLKYELIQSKYLIQKYENEIKRLQNSYCEIKNSFDDYKNEYRSIIDFYNQFRQNMGFIKSFKPFLTSAKDRLNYICDLLQKFKR